MPVNAVPPLRWILIESLCFDFKVDKFGSIYVDSMSGYVSLKLFKRGN